MPHSASDYIFFWKPSEPHGWASQWATSPFTVPIDGFGDVTFATAEHWMMFHKAILFGDTNVAHQVLKIPGDSAGALAKVKALGRQVHDFDDAKWNENRSRIVLEGSLHKFRQNKEMRDKLLDTGSKFLVEASPRDRIWGVGYGQKNAYNMRNQWGLNLLGIALEQTRAVLSKEMEVGSAAIES